MVQPLQLLQPHYTIRLMYDTTITTTTTTIQSV